MSFLSKEKFVQKEFKKFCHILGFSRPEISKLLSEIPNNYTIWNEVKIDKITGLPKTFSDGTEKVRTFGNPSNFLKVVQKRIKKNILENIKLPQVVHGGVKGKSNITNAKRHQGNKYQFCTDLQDFYPNISSKQVYESLISVGFNPFFSHWITKLTTYKNQIPQGAPTSTTVSNIVFFATDIKLIEKCKEYNIVYTRYIDDLTFSSQSDFSHLINDIINIVSSSNFKISRRKTHYNSEQIITGIRVLLHKIDCPDAIKLRVIEEQNNRELLLRPYTSYQSRVITTNSKKLISAKSTESSPF